MFKKIKENIRRKKVIKDITKFLLDYYAEICRKDLDALDKQMAAGGGIYKESMHVNDLPDLYKFIGLTKACDEDDLYFVIIIDGVLTVKTNCHGDKDEMVRDVVDCMLDRYSEYLNDHDVTNLSQCEKQYAINIITKYYRRVCKE